MNRFSTCVKVTAFAVVSLLSSCGGKGDKNAPDVSKINLPYQSYPFYKDFAALDPKHIPEGLQQLQQKYPEFTDFYLDNMIQFGYHHDYTKNVPLMDSFLLQKDYRSLLDTVVQAFPNTGKYDEWLKKTFRYIRYYDSTFQVPQHVYYYISGLNGMTTVLQSDKNMGVGLDLFLGRDYYPYKQLSIPDYATVRMTADNIPVWAAQAIYQDKYPLKADDQDLLSLMIQKGKEMYFVEQVTPYLGDEVRFGITKAQMEWCFKNEALIYNFFIQNQLLYNKNMQKVFRYVNDGPSAAGMPPESPSNVGTFIGWRIVKKYAEQHNATMHQVLETSNAQQLLEASHYKP